MPADFSEYINLTVHDKDAGTLYREMIEVARAVMPDFNLRRGTLEDALFQSCAYLAATATNSINRVPNGIMQGIVSLMGYERPIGTRATATATVVLYGTTGEIIPSGTEFRYRYTNTTAGYETDYLFVTSEDTVIVDAGTPTGVINLVSGQFGEMPVPTVGESTLMPLSIDTNINTVTFTTFQNGTNPLTDQEYLSSAKTFLESISTTFVTAKQLEAAILVNFPYVSRCKVYDLMNAGIPSATNPPDRGVLTFTPDATRSITYATYPSYRGFVSIFLYGYTGELSSGQLSEIQLFATERVMAGLEVGTYNFKTAQLATSGGVVVDAAIDSNYDFAYAEELIKISISSFLSPQNFPYEELSVASPRIRESTIISRLLSTVPGLRYVNSVQFTPPAALSYTVVTGSGVTENTTGDVKITALSADVAKLVVGQRIRLTDVSGTAYTNNSIAVKSKINTTTFTIETDYSTNVAASSLRENFYETSASTTLNFLNRGVLPDVPTTAINVTLSTEPS